MEFNPVFAFAPSESSIGLDTDLYGVKRMSEQALLDLIKTLVEAISNLNDERPKNLLHHAGGYCWKVDALHKTLSSTFLRMLAARIERK